MGAPNLVLGVIACLSSTSGTLCALKNNRNLFSLQEVLIFFLHFVYLLEMQKID